jgi:hypothetical protein
MPGVGLWRSERGEPANKRAFLPILARAIRFVNRHNTAETAQGQRSGKRRLNGPRPWRATR